MDLKQIKELIATLEKSKVKKISIKERNGSEITLEKESAFDDSLNLSLASKQAHSALHQQGGEFHPSPADKSPPKDSGGEEEGTFITSPMVGTFYRSPGPGEPPFVQVGDRVEKDTVVCIVEAMKVMNEVKAGCAGTIQEAPMEEGHAVEFGTKLFRIV